ncbi:MAG: MlaD family protein [Bacteroidia bacterium]
MKREIKIGLTVLLAVIFFYLIIAWVKRVHFFAPEENTYIIYFQQVNGLLEGDPVKVRGYQSGRVSLISPDAEKVVVEIKLDKKIAVNTDATAEIRIKELLGGKLVEVLPGTSGKLLPSGEVIQGKTAPDFTTAFSQFGNISDNLDFDKIFTFFERMDSVVVRLDRFAASIDPSVANQAMGDLTTTLSETRMIMQQLRRSGLIDQVDSSLGQVQTFLGRTNRLMDDFESVSRSAESDLLPKADTLVTQLNQSLGELDITLNQANKLLTKLNDNQTIAGRVFNDPELSAQLDTTLFNLNKTLEQIHSKRVIIGISRKKEKR